ncbi:MAG TPA: hypothetical protein VLH94_04300 [Spirochaetia bacterium]|nr:hypothetical protein [Spirochaetia bacterium]
MSTMSSQADGHCHYSGSLSRQYLQNRIDFLFPHQGIPVSNFLPQFTLNWEKNFKQFFDSYQKVQLLTQSAIPEEQYQLYSSGAYDICKNYILEGVSSFDLRAGPKLKLSGTVDRLSAMIEGFNNAENEFNTSKKARLILTLIHDQKGKFTNVNISSLTELLAYLDTNKKIANRVIGFDFSGPEICIDSHMFFSLLNLIEKYNSNDEHLKKYIITIHAGEYSDKDTIFPRLSFIDQLLNHKINRISHGTILWLNPSLINTDKQKEIETYQNRLLNKIADKNIILEICPTSNLLLSPLKKISDIPFQKFNKLGIKYTINTDNKTLIGTNLSREISLTQSH